MADPTSPGISILNLPRTKTRTTEIAPAVPLAATLVVGACDGCRTACRSSIVMIGPFG